MTKEQAEAAVQKLFASDSLELKHYGVPGMKWGVRRNSSGSSSGSTPSTPTQGAVLTKTPAPKPKFAKGDITPVGNAFIGPRKMTDAQLAAALKRLNMEKQYKELNNPGVAETKKAVRDVLINSGKVVATTYVTHLLFKGAVKTTRLDLQPKKDEKKGEKKKDD